MNDQAMEFIIVQHAEKSPVCDDPGITAHGLEQAKATAHYLSRASISALYTSLLRRAYETAEVLADHLNIDVRVDARLAE
jgi:broad specificity phosphatase PhoE